MGFKVALFAGLLLLVVAPARTVASPFVNLDFEQAVVPPGTGPAVAASTAFPGWTPRIASLVQSEVYYNYPGIGEGCVVLYDQPLSIGGLPVLEGHFSVALISGGATEEASLSQRGEIPVDARSLLFLGPPRPPAVVAIDGNVLDLVSLPNEESSLPLWGADITRFAGSNVDLRLSSVHPPNGNIAGIDSLRFSTQPVPEPALPGLLTFAAVWAWTHRARGR